jgi:TonB family protein
MHKLSGRFHRRGDDSTPSRDPVMAAALSVVPGLGQLYNGQSARGFLFFDVALVNFVILWLMLFTEPIVRALSAFSTEFHIKPNQELLHALNQLHIGTPVSSAVLLLILGFVGYAARDAYDQAKSKRLQAIYPDHTIEMPEATSGSYLLHLSMILTCAVLALFFILPPPPRTQVTDIEFIETTQQTKPPENTTKRSNHSSNTDARRDPTRPAAMAHAAAQAASHAATQPRQTAQAHPAQAHPETRQVQTARTAAPPANQPAQAKQSTAADSPPPAFHPRLVNTLKPLASPVVPAAQAPTHAVSAPVPMPIATAKSLDGTAALPLPQPLAHGPSGMVQPMPSAQPLLAMAGTGHTPLPHMGATSGNTNSAQPAAPGPVHSIGKSGTSPEPQPAMTHGPVGPGSEKGQPGPTPARFAPSVAGPGGLVGTPILPRGDGRTDGPGKARIDVDFGPYMAMLQHRIKMHWIPPKYPTSNHVQVRFKVSRSGELSELKLVRSSGQAEADRFALRAIEEAAPFPHLPEGADENVDIEFTFDYNVFGTGNSFHRF